MTDNVNYLELVKQAQIGHKESMSNLTELVEGGLCAYVYRLTLNYDLSQDLVQDTPLEMIKSLRKLEFDHIRQFWAWLYRTALGKVQLHFRAQQHEKTVQMSMLDKRRQLLVF
jgi:DNA-directed RNA polymerase specialized sigma24 family protein